MIFEIDFFSQQPEAITQMANQKLQTAVEDWEKQIWQFIVDWFNPNIKSITVQTSGSTGAPKQITHSKAAMLNSAAATCNALHLKAGDTALLCLPVNKIGGMMMLVRSIHLKMKLLCIKPSTKPLGELPDNIRIDFAAFTPMQFHEITTNYAIFKKADQIRKVILGGEDVRAELLLNIKKLESEVYITFGMTETISHIALKRLNGLTPDPYFKTLPGIEISTNEKGTLVISAPALERPKLVTNDVVRITGEHEFQWLGRMDNVINTGGIKIYPEEIEQQLLNAIEAPFFISSLPDKVSGEKLVLALEMNALTAEEEQELQEALLKLKKLHRPKQVLLIIHFVRTSNGKVKRKESLSNVSETLDLSRQ